MTSTPILSDVEDRHQRILLDSCLELVLSIAPTSSPATRDSFIDNLILRLLASKSTTSGTSSVQSTQSTHGISPLLDSDSSLPKRRRVVVSNSSFLDSQQPLRPDFSRLPPDVICSEILPHLLAFVEFRVDHFRDRSDPSWEAFWRLGLLHEIFRNSANTPCTYRLRESEAKNLQPARSNRGVDSEPSLLLFGRFKRDVFRHPWFLFRSVSVQVSPRGTSSLSRLARRPSQKIVNSLLPLCSRQLHHLVVALCLGRYITQSPEFPLLQSLVTWNAARKTRRDSRGRVVRLWRESPIYSNKSLVECRSLQLIDSSFRKHGVKELSFGPEPFPWNGEKLHLLTRPRRYVHRSCFYNVGRIFSSLTNLRHLRIDGGLVSVHRGGGFKGSFPALPRLEILHLRNVEIDDSVFQNSSFDCLHTLILISVKKLTMLNVRNVASSLKVLKLTSVSTRRRFPFSMDLFLPDYVGCVKLRILEVDGINDVEDWIERIDFETLEVLRIANCGKRSQTVFHLPMIPLNVKRLSLFPISFLPSSRRFPKVERVVLRIGGWGSTPMTCLETFVRLEELEERNPDDGESQLLSSVELFRNVDMSLVGQLSVNLLCLEIGEWPAEFRFLKVLILSGVRLRSHVPFEVTEFPSLKHLSLLLTKDFSLSDLGGSWKMLESVIDDLEIMKVGMLRRFARCIRSLPLSGDEVSDVTNFHPLDSFGVMFPDVGNSALERIDIGISMKVKPNKGMRVERGFTLWRGPIDVDLPDLPPLGQDIYDVSYSKRKRIELRMESTWVLKQYVLPTQEVLEEKGYYGEFPVTLLTPNNLAPGSLREVLLSIIRLEAMLKFDLHCQTLGASNLRAEDEALPRRFFEDDYDSSSLSSSSSSSSSSSTSSSSSSSSSEDEDYY